MVGYASNEEIRNVRDEPPDGQENESFRLSISKDYNKPSKEVERYDPSVSYVKELPQVVG